MYYYTNKKALSLRRGDSAFLSLAALLDRKWRAAFAAAATENSHTTFGLGTSQETMGGHALFLRGLICSFWHCAKLYRSNYKKATVSYMVTSQRHTVFWRTRAFIVVHSLCTLDSWRLQNGLLFLKNFKNVYSLREVGIMLGTFVNSDVSHFYESDLTIHPKQHCAHRAYWCEEIVGRRTG